MSDADEARERAQREINNNMGPAQTHTWDSNTREAYEAERARLEQEQRNKKSS